MSTDSTDEQTNAPVSSDCTDGSEASLSQHFKDGDIKFRSSDNVIFQIHQKYLEMSTGGFPSCDVNGSTAATTQDEIVSLPETSFVLDVLFRFVYPKLQPDLFDIEDFGQLMDVARAAEKYIVYNAISACQLRLSLFCRDFSPKHANELFDFAAAHDHPALLVTTSKSMIHKPLEEVAHKLTADTYKPWSLYHSRVLLACNSILGATGNGRCTNDTCQLEKNRQLINQSPANVFYIKSKLQAEYYTKPCCSSYSSWQNAKAAGVRNLPDFGTILRAHRKQQSRR
ncbi:hypothetical protein K435DRAFT_732268 [Dendrothele bispora CBS 962.96]|uniref:BTB domain-containing protein n=1 Tax=Dendrothele bispora (strain CBS 962.96) TaxID=1314807 RepID=A0A4V4HD13_DENBC|nr:hypothetical protein K435DRAFT_732268 [Dendrothele bispora CBS 962.96]